MAYRKQRITLDIIYDDDEQEEPETWNFAELLDLPDDTHARVVVSEPSADAESETN